MRYERTTTRVSQISNQYNHKSKQKTTIAKSKHTQQIRNISDSQQTTTAMKIFNKSLFVLLPLVSFAGASSHFRGSDDLNVNNDNSNRDLQLSSCSGEPQFQPTTLLAQIDTEYLQADIKGMDTAPGKVEWTITINYVDDNLCPEDNALHWHAHTQALKNPGCYGYSGLIADGSVPECMATMGHVDNGLACGGASEYLDTTCTALNYADPYSTRCTPDKQNGCEYGDLSGKMGLVDLTKIGEDQVFEDNYIQTPIVDYWYAKSIVFHCGAPRVACTNFVVAE